MIQRQLRVLFVDDERDQLDMVVRLLTPQGFAVETASSPIGVAIIARKFGPDVVLLDVRMPALFGHELVPLLRRHSTDVQRRFVLFSACDPEKLRSLANKVGADAWIQKGEPNDLARKLRMICEA